MLPMSGISRRAEAGLARVGGAKCGPERDLGYLEKKFMVELTRGKEITVTSDYGKERYGRSVVELDVDGADVSERGISAGHIRPWPHKGQKALNSKPDWCTAG